MYAYAVFAGSGAISRAKFTCRLNTYPAGN